ncbi:MAG: transposase [Acidobacteriota bacterium]
MHNFPMAYLISFRCYGTWLHGDVRGSMDRRGHHIYGTPKIKPNHALAKKEAAQLKYSPKQLDASRRAIIEKAIQEVCEHRGYRLLAFNVRTNHVHSVVSASCKPEPVLNAFKAYATRHLRKADVLSSDEKIWARHGSTPYLWTERQVEQAIDYVLYGQGDELPKFD